MLPPSIVTRVVLPLLPPGAPSIGTKVRPSVETAGGLNAGFEFGELKKVAAVERQVLDLALRHYSTYGGRIVAHLRCRAVHGN